MLIRFVVSNFMSFKEETEFNMLPGKGKGYKQHKNHIKTTESGVDVLKTAVVYGANASGKSNFVSAIEYVRNIITGYESGEESLVPLSKRFRLNDSYKSKPTTFRLEYEFGGVHFDYGVEIKNGEIKEEWLYKIESINKQKEVLLFSRKENEIVFGDYYSKIDVSFVEVFIKKKLEGNVSGIEMVHGNIDDDELIDLFYESMRTLIVLTPTMYNSTYTSSVLKREESKDYVEEILRKSNTGISELVIKDIPIDTFFSYEDEDYKSYLVGELEDEIKNSQDSDDFSLSFAGNKGYNVLRKLNGEYFVSVLKTKHQNSDNLFDFHEESDGTNRLFQLLPAFQSLNGFENIVYVIDELERSMHPILAKELLRLYVNNSNSKSQLIFTTHESHLLDFDLLRQDEIWFAEKKIDGSSIFYPLSDYKPREDKNIRLGYLEGRYGGIPFLGDFSKLK